MTSAQGPGHPAAPGGTFRNPLHPVVLGDPFILKFNGSYYAYGTPTSGGIPVLRSFDLVNWDRAGEALPAPPAGRSHWAPEVAYDNGRFFLYCSTGGAEGEGHQLRVAVATSPTGPFRPAEEVLDPADPFTIDAHPFRDDDGQWYLFYSRDFLEGDRVGTGIVVDRLVGMERLAGERQTVVRPHADWHIYERQRHWYGRVWDWFTVEGPFVRKHDGRYWCFYSGGAWRAENYGVGCAVADHPLGPYRPAAAGDGAEVLRTVAGSVIGPGHACVVAAPDNVTDYIVYHAWDPPLTGRYMFADRLSWVDGRPFSPGPCTGPQPYPPAPVFRDLFGGGGSSRDPGPWRPTGRWERSPAQARLIPEGRAAASVLAVPSPESHLLEVNVALRGHPGADAGYGALASFADEANYDAVLLRPARDEVVLRRVVGGTAEERVLGRLGEAFRSEAFHRLLLRRDAGALAVSLDGVALERPRCQMAAGAVGVYCQAPAAFAGVALTALSPG